MKRVTGLFCLLLFFIAGHAQTTNSKTEAKIMEYNKLTPFEEWVIQQKGTERPNTGKFNNHYENGTYVCRQCNAPLYSSEDKFKSHCGWPSFDDEILGAITKKTDADGMRTEILCANCGGHLGHVFFGEGFTNKNTRHCVNSVSMGFIPAKVQEAKAIFASGCFWGTEYYLSQLPGVLATTVGFTGGTVENPTSEEVHAGKSGHVEAVEVIYDPSKVDYETLAKIFFEIHDPTQANGQGTDIGPQYRSVVFYTDHTQKEVAENLIEELKQKGYGVVTEVKEAGVFYKADEKHQDYYFRTSGTPTCHKYTKRF
ncbi:bifunctional methionine sulfoxide reductase B/A protein [Limibacter armeniacum]|uniref:bifunctional methionine sulfoxide reductase B/A protein n=1 Tax=Limibacter armeniacum TaxID=466084 RepID=UPI002FE56AE2